MPLATTPYKLGIENIGHQLDHLKHKPSALVTNQSGIDQQGNRTVDILLKKDFNLKRLLAPEHGITGLVPAEKNVTQSFEPKTKLPVMSTYQGENNPVPSEKILENIEVLFFDIQDCGMRHYTYISTLYHLLILCEKKGITVVVFDRPNPIGPTMEGPLVEEKLQSFLAVAPIPLRHGMTIGEIACYFNEKQLKKPANLVIVSMKEYKRDTVISHFDAQLSPNIQDIQSCYGYTFLELLAKVDPLFTGRNTEHPFKILMCYSNHSLSIKTWHEIAAILTENNLLCHLYTFDNKLLVSKDAGLYIIIPTINNFSAYNTLIKILEYFKKHNIELHFTPWFNLHIGTSTTLDYLEGKISKEELKRTINEELEGFHKKASPCFHYEPHPRIMYVED